VKSDRCLWGLWRRVPWHLEEVLVNTRDSRREGISAYIKGRAVGLSKALLLIVSQWSPGVTPEV
jgi:hypothetical protein